MKQRVEVVESRQPARSPKFERAWRARFEEFAQKGDDDAAIAGWSQAGLEARLTHFRAVWPGDRRGARWLDAGCGAATYTRFLQEAGIDAIGMDYSLPTIEKARQRSPAMHQWYVGDVQKLPIRPGTLDGVLCFGVTQALSRSDDAITELAGVLAPGGQLWIDALNGACLPNLLIRAWRWARGKPMHLRYESPRALRKLLLARNMGNVRLYWVPIMPGRFRRWQPLLEKPVARWLFRTVPLLGWMASHAFVLSAVKKP